MTAAQKLGAILLAGLFATTTEAIAACASGDLAGDWSMHTETIPSFGPKQAMICNVTLSGGSPYSANGTCKLYTPTSASDGDLLIAASASLAESPACKFSGTFGLGDGGPIFVIATILDARIEDNGTTTKTHIHGIAHYNFGGPDNVMNFKFTR
jgi:hypothetical protein